MKDSINGGSRVSERRSCFDQTFAKPLTNVFQGPSQSPYSPPRHDQPRSSLPLKFNPSRGQNQVRSSDARNGPKTSQNLFEKKQPVRMWGNETQVNATKGKTPQTPSSFRSDIPYTGEDSKDLRRDASRARTRSDPYKTRGSIVAKLARGEQAFEEHKAPQKTSVRKPTAHTLRMRAKPRMDVYIPTTVTVSTLARILNVKFGAVLSLSTQKYSSQC